MTATEMTETHTDSVPAREDGPRCDGAAGAVWGALKGNPGATPAEIAGAAAVGRSTAARVLIDLESDGFAVRDPGGRDGRKVLPDRWAPAPTATAKEVADVKEADVYSGTDADADAGTDTMPEDGDTGETPPSEDDDAFDSMDEEAVCEARDALSVIRDAADSVMVALAIGDRTAAMEAMEAAYGESGRARRLVRAAVNGRPRNASGRLRSNPGEMRAKVSAHLAAHPAAELTPHEIGKVIGHSAGAIANALDRLVAIGEAVQTCERPRRFTAVTDPGPAPSGP